MQKFDGSDLPGFDPRLVSEVKVVSEISDAGPAVRMSIDGAQFVLAPQSALDAGILLMRSAFRLGLVCEMACASEELSSLHAERLADILDRLSKKNTEGEGL